MIVDFWSVWGVWLLAMGQPAPTRPSVADVVERAQETSVQLETCRQGLLDPKARPDERRRWTDLLLSYDTPEAGVLVFELLSTSRPEIQLPLCRGIAERSAPRLPSWEAALVEPLLDLLGAESEELRSSAARALAVFDHAGAFSALFEIASHPDEPLPKRQAAIEAMSPNLYRRDLLERFITLLDSKPPEIVERAAAALDASTERGWGGDVQAWKEWWRGQRLLSDEAWYLAQLRRQRDRCRKFSEDSQAMKAEFERNQAELVSRLREFARDTLKGMTAEQRDAKLVEWLDDPLPTVKLATLGLVKARIADEGKRPEGAVLASLLRLLQDEAPAVRRESLLIAQNLGETSVVNAVLVRLLEEKDLPLRHAVFQALGKLGSIHAIPDLLREIGSPQSTPDCVREASLALAALATRPEAKDALSNSASVLLDRFLKSRGGPPTLRAALLSAMAGIGDAAFLPEFRESVEMEDVGVLEAGLRGLRAAGDGTKAARCRALTGHADARVRVAAIETTAALGRDEADIEALIIRLNPAVETNDLAREAAWRGLKHALSKRPVAERMRVIEQLREIPDAPIRYMEEQVAALAAAGGNAAELEEFRDRLAAALTSMGREAEAVPHLRELFSLRSSRGDPTAGAIGLRWLQAVMLSPTPSGVAEVVSRLAESSGETERRSEIIRTVQQSCEAACIVNDEERSRRLLNELRTVSAEPLGDEWLQFLRNFEAQVDSLSKDKLPKPPS